MTTQNQPPLFGPDPATTRPDTTTPDKIPAWLAKLLPPPRTARPRTCGRCHALTLTGFDNQHEIETLTADPTRLTPATELTAILAGRRTIMIQHHPNGPRLARRYWWTILRDPANTVTVAPEHKCREPIPGPQIRITDLYRKPSKGKGNAEPPF